MKVLVVVSALLGVSAALYQGNPLACLNGACTAPYGAAYTPYATPYAAGLPYARSYAAGLPYARSYAAGVLRPAALTYAPAVPVAASSQFQAQDELGQYRYGYSGPLSAKIETKNAFGGTVGSYSYLDANGLKQTVSYVADAAGFRVKATNLPVAPVASLQAPIFSQVGPAPVDDTAEVKAAKAEFQQLYNEAAAAADAAPDARRRRSLKAPIAPHDTYEVTAAKALHAHLYRAAELRAAGVPVPTPVLLDTPAVQLEKARHAALYNQAAVRAAISPDYSPYNYGLGLRSGLLAAPGLIL